MSLYKEQLKKYLSQVDLKAHAVLSIGGENDDRKYFNSTQVSQWKTLDVDVEFRPDILHDMNKDIVSSEGDTMLPMEYFDSFDAVLAFELWDYIYDPMTAHKNIYELLKSGGLYMGSYPFVYPHHEPIEHDALRYTNSGIIKILTKCGFSDIKITERVATAGRGHLSNFIGAEGMKLAKRLAPYTFPIGYIVEARK